MIGQQAVIAAAVQRIQGVDPGARVHSRWRYPQQGRLAEYARLFREGGSPQGKINGYMMRLKRTPLMKGVQARLVSATYTLSIRSYQHLIESDDDAAASEMLVRTKNDLIAAAFEADVTLGLGPAVYHTGVEMPIDMLDVILGDAGVHRTDYQLNIAVANVNC